MSKGKCTRGSLFDEYSQPDPADCDVSSSGTFNWARAMRRDWFLRYDRLKCFRVRCLVWALLLSNAIPGFCQSVATLTVTSAASYELMVSPDSLASVFGTGFSKEVVPAELDVNGDLPTELGGVSVEINGRKAGLIFVSPKQINLWVPLLTEIGEAQVVVRRPDGMALSSGTVSVRRTAPGLFSLDASGTGPGAVMNPITSELEPFRVETTENPGSDKRTRLAIYSTGLRFAGNLKMDPSVSNVAEHRECP